MGSQGLLIARVISAFETPTRPGTIAPFITRKKRIAKALFLKLSNARDPLGLGLGPSTVADTARRVVAPNRPIMRSASNASPASAFSIFATTTSGDVVVMPPRFAATL